jgi:hypothetical protein
VFSLSIYKKNDAIIQPKGIFTLISMCRTKYISLKRPSHKNNILIECKDFPVPLQNPCRIYFFDNLRPICKSPTIIFPKFWFYLASLCYSWEESEYVGQKEKNKVKIEGGESWTKKSRFGYHQSDTRT